eukprot:Amastigsp_a841323_56.p2 type:complete len:214 gc:universal Amastigsp_a841323_56:717-76(-)
MPRRGERALDGLVEELEEDGVHERVEVCLGAVVVDREEVAPEVSVRHGELRRVLRDCVERLVDVAHKVEQKTDRHLLAVRDGCRGVEHCGELLNGPHDVEILRRRHRRIVRVRVVRDRHIVKTIENGHRHRFEIVRPHGRRLELVRRGELRRELGDKGAGNSGDLGAKTLERDLCNKHVALVPPAVAQRAQRKQRCDKGDSGNHALRRTMRRS